jgi:uncharacterized membrane protein
MALLGYLMAKYRPTHWLAWHIAGQSGSFIALITGILFQLVPRFWHSDARFPGVSPVLWVTLLTPFVVGTFFIVRTEKKWEHVSVRLQQCRPSGESPV